MIAKITADRMAVYKRNKIYCVEVRRQSYGRIPFTTEARRSRSGENPTHTQDNRTGATPDRGDEEAHDV